MNFHKQDLNDSHPKKYLSAGRCWWNHGQILQIEWCIPASRGLALGLDLCTHDHAMQLHMALFLFSLWIGTDNRRLYNFLEPLTKRKDAKYTNGRLIGFYFFERALWVQLWDDPHESRHDDPKWWGFVIHFDDLILGSAKHTVEILQDGSAEIDMPEGVYPATYKVERRTWKRPRWPWPVVHTSASFDIPAGIPHEGKGENSYDCGMDGTFGTGTYWDGNIYNAAKRIALECLKTRQRYGSLSSPEYKTWFDKRVALVELRRQADEVMREKYEARGANA